MVYCLILYIIREVCEVHVSFSGQCVVECECCCEVVLCVSSVGNFEIVPEQLFVVGVCAVFNDELCALHGAFSSEVGNSLFGYDDVDIVF